MPMSEAYSQTVVLLKRLAALMAKGQGDGEEADEVRGQMDQHLYHLTPSEEATARSLSADLDALEEEPPARTTPPTAETREALDRALDSSDWLRVLALLRENTGLRSAETRAFLRSHCWRQLGEEEVAEAFSVQAIRLVRRSEQGSLSNRAGSCRPFPRLGPIERRNR